MTIDLSTFESALQTKLDAFSGTEDVEDFVLLTKAINDIEVGLTTSFASFGDLPAAGDHQGRIVYVSGNDRVYYSDGENWVTIATSQNPDFNTALLDVDSVATENYGLITESVTTTEDYGAVTGSVTASEDFGFDLGIQNAGTQGDIYIDPSDWTFTIYDGSTRAGIKHLRADKNNLNFATMSAKNQGVAHILKDNNTSTSGAMKPVPFTSTRLNDTRMGYLDSDGYYYVNYDGWYEVTVDTHTSAACFLGLGNIADYATDEGSGTQGPDDQTIMYTNQSGPISFKRVVYCPVAGSIALFLAGTDADNSAEVYGSGSFIGSNRNSNYENFTQMNIKFLGSDTETNSYQVAAS